MRENVVKIYIFDLDGTLVDSMSHYSDGVLSVLDKRAIRYDDKLIDIITPLGYQGTAEYYKRVMGVKDSVEDIVEEIRTTLYDKYAHHIVLKEGVLEYLQSLSNQGARMFVLTASPHLVTDICLQNNKVYDLFEDIWSVDEFGGLTKSDVELFDVVADKIGCTPEEVNYFDDNIIAIQNATRADYNTYAVEDRQSQEVLTQLKNTAKYYVRSFNDL